MIKPTIHVDEFISKIGGDDDFMVLSFYVKSELAADDLVDWFERGYEYVLDADKSPGEIKPNRYLVYVEISRRTRVIRQMEEMITDLETLTEHKLSDWKVTFDGKKYPFDPDTLHDILILSPRQWRRIHEEDLNEMRNKAGVPIKTQPRLKDKDLDIVRQQAGIL